jgi:hypothetical protein
LSTSIHARERAAAAAVAALSKGNTYDHWKAIAHGLQAGREAAMAAAGVNSPFGPRYKAELASWQQRNPWAQDPKLRPPIPSYCNWLVENLAVVEAWRASLPDDERLRFNHPGTIRREFLKAQQGAPGGGRGPGAAPPQGNNPNRPTKAMLDALRQAFDALQAEYDKLTAEHAALKTQGGGLNGYARFPILGFGDAPFTDMQVTAVHRRLSTIFHPDNKATGSHEQMQRLNKERDTALKEAQPDAGQPGGTGVSAP